MKRLLLILLLAFPNLSGQSFPLYAARTVSTAQPLLLDAFPGATLAYSVRRLSSTYSGPCLRIIRASDLAEQDIGFNGLDFDAAAASAFCGLYNGNVTVWYDQSANANHAYGTNGINVPRIVTGGGVAYYGTRPQLYNATTFDFHFYLTTPVSGIQPWTMLAIWNRSSATRADAVMAFLANLNAAPEVVTDNGGATDNPNNLYITTSAFYSSYDLGVNLAATMGVFVNSSSENVYFGSTQQTPTVNHFPNAGSSNFEVLGFNNTTPSLGTGHRGAMQEVVFWNSDKSSDWPAIYANQTNYFGHP